MFWRMWPQAFGQGVFAGVVGIQTGVHQQTWVSLRYSCSSIGHPLADTGQLSSHGSYFTNNKGPEGPLLNLLALPPGGGCCANASQAVASDLQFTLHSFVVVVLQAILVAYHLAIQLVYQFIHSGVQV